MSRTLILTLALLAMLAARPGLAEIENPGRGWVLYSWQTNKGWFYALLPKPAVEHSKHWAELNLVKVAGWEALRTRLSNIRSGEHMAFGTAEEIDDLPSQRLIEFPRTDIRIKIRRYSKERGFDLGSILPPARSTLSN
jgi:hypothetical protein